MKPLVSNSVVATILFFTFGVFAFIAGMTVSSRSSSSSPEETHLVALDHKWPNVGDLVCGRQDGLPIVGKVQNKRLELNELGIWKRIGSIEEQAETRGDGIEFRNGRHLQFDLDLLQQCPQ